MSIETFFNDAVDVKYLKKDSADADLEGYVLKISGLKCMIQPQAPESAILNETGSLFKSAIMYCPFGTNIVDTDKIIHGDDEYIVLGTEPLRDYGDSDRHLKVTMQKQDES